MTHAEIISIGDEILIGQISNTNAAYIASELNSIGIRVIKISTVGDSSAQIRQALSDASTHSNLVIITGGLGPTNDDITKKTLCEYFNSDLIIDENALSDITILFASRGMSVSELNYKQAEVPNNCKVLRNTEGTAPGMWFIKNEIHYFSLPGVPYEMKKIMNEQIIPILLKNNMGENIVHKTIYTMGMGESALAEFIKDWENNLPEHIHLAYLPEPGIVKLRLSSYSSQQKNIEEQIQHQFQQLRLLIPDLIFSENLESIQEVIGKILLKKEQTISTAESCTGGYISHLITSVPGSSAYYKGSIIAYANNIKTDVLNIPASTIEDHGAVSKEVVTAMALSVRQIMGTDYSIAISGIAGPDGGTEDKPVGTVWIAIITPQTQIAEKFILGNDRERNIRRSSLFALNLLRKELIKNI